MPYAAKAKVEHEFETDHLNVWLTFRKSMDVSRKPPLVLWVLVADEVEIEVVDSAWQDPWTLLLTSDVMTSRPARVTLAYNGPNSNLQTTWGKDWEPWGPILSKDLTAAVIPAGLIVMWSGAAVDIPDGWTLCDGTAGTPDLRDKFIVSASDTNPPGSTGGSSEHNHTSPTHTHTAYLPQGTFIQQGSGYDEGVRTTGTAATINSTNHLPPYYALCYIMKL